MNKVAIIYWSGTGNTEAMADLIAQGVRTAGGEADLSTALDYEAQAFATAAATEDFREGTSAFMERRKAVFTGR